MKNILDNKLINILFGIIEWIICLVLIFLIVLTGVQRFSNQGNFFGYRIYTVASGSMIPTYDIGDTLLIKETGASGIKKGDAVTYIGNSGGVDGMIITHQVIDIQKDENGKVVFHTKGIANNIEDPLVYEEQVLGKVIHKFFLLSYLGKITTSKYLMLIFITLPIAILITIEIIKIVYKKDDDDDDFDSDTEDNNEKSVDEKESIELSDDKIIKESTEKVESKEINEEKEELEVTSEKEQQENS